ncbi:MAG: hypothetical protein M3P97_08765 [Actinomycetota bacterium]|jgi:hypothetical protein|nr:hypothetical protein [Actinomycetota bacterium]
MPENTNPEDAVRRYLTFLDDPSKLIDQTAIKRAETAANNAKDPLQRLHALAELAQVRSADGEQLRRDFVRNAKRYADEQGIPPTAFREMGVPGDVLAEAGLDGTPRRGQVTAAASRQRAPRVPLERLKAAVNRLPKQFTLSDLGEKAGGGSPATLRKAVDELISEGKVTRIGPKSDYSGRGRAPIVYQVK